MEIIPQPKEVVKTGRDFVLDEKTEIFLPPKASKTIVCLATLLQNKIQKSCGMRIPIKGAIGKRRYDKSVKPIMIQCSGEKGAEGYSIEVLKNKILIRGDSPQGGGYGIETIMQVFNGEKKTIPGVRIKDWPSLKVRAIHLDLVERMLKFDYLKDIVRRAAQYKINYILVEYGDKFKYDKHPLISSNEALSKNEITKLIALARKYFIEFIPFVQSFGHLQYVFANEKYRHMAEKEEQNISSYCPLHSESFAMFRDMADEMMNVHPLSKYFHVGGDETALGLCEKCKEKYSKEGKGKLYSEHINKVCEYILSKGRIPLVWGDMLIRYPGCLNTLPKKTVIVDWDYGSFGKEMESFQFPGGLPDIKAGIINKDTIGKVPKALLRVYRKYWDAGTGSYPDKFASFPFTKYFVDKGFQVIGASAVASGLGPNGYCATDMPYAVRNLSSFPLKAAEVKGLGIIATSWMRGSMPCEMFFYGFVISAEYCWSVGNSPEKKEFEKKFNKIFYGVEKTDLIKTKYLLSHPRVYYTGMRPYYYDMNDRGRMKGKLPIGALIEKFENSGEVHDGLKNAFQMVKNSKEAINILGSAAGKVKRNNMNVEYWLLAAETLSLKAEQVLLYHEIFRKNGSRRLLNSLKEFYGRMLLLEGKTRRIFSRTMTKESVERELSMRYGSEKKYIEKLISATSPVCSAGVKEHS